MRRVPRDRIRIDAPPRREPYGVGDLRPTQLVIRVGREFPPAPPDERSRRPVVAPPIHHPNMLEDPAIGWTGGLEPSVSVIAGRPRFVRPV